MDNPIWFWIKSAVEVLFCQCNTVQWLVGLLFAVNLFIMVALIVRPFMRKVIDRH